MVFTNSQILGRIGAVTMNLMGKHAGGRIRRDLDVALGWWKEAVTLRAKPRSLTVGESRPPILIFTDGAHELKKSPDSEGTWEEKWSGGCQNKARRNRS